MPMYLYLSDIIRMETDAIVSAAGTDLRRCPDICDAIFVAAGTEKLERACRKLGRCRIGQVVVTPGCELPCRYIIRVAGPGRYSGKPREQFLLARCYQNALHKTCLCSCRRAAVPLILSGNCHMPRAVSLRVVGATTAGFCQRHPFMEAALMLYRQSIYDMAKRILGWEDASS